MYLFFIINRDNNIKFYKEDYPYYLILILFVIYVILSVFYNYFGPVVWIIGLLSYLGYAILMFISPYVLNNLNKIESFFDYIIYLSIPIFILGFIQYFLPQNHFLNSYSSDMDYIATAGGFTRVISIFNYIAGYTTYLAFALIIIFTKMIIEEGSKRLFLFLVFILGIFNLFATGSRAPVVIVALSVGLLLLWVVFYSEKRTKIKFLFFLSLSLIIVISLNYFQIISFSSFDSLMSRSKDIKEGEMLYRIIDLYTTPFEYAKISGLAGFGVGTAHQISNAFGYNLNNYFLVPYEETLERFVLELGIVGTILFILLMFSIFFDLIRKIYYIKDKKIKLYAFALFTTLIQFFIFLNNIPYNWLGSLHFYLSVGLIISLYNIDLQKQYEARKDIEN